MTLPVVRRVHLKCYTDFLTRLGAPVDRMLQKAGLPVVQQPGSEFMSNRGYFEFVHLAARSEGISDLGYRAAMPVGRSRLSEAVITRIERSPTLYSALRRFSRDIHADASHIQTGVAEEAGRVWFWQRSHPAAGPVGWDISEQLVASMVLDIVRYFAGSGWCPDELRTRSPLIQTHARELMPNTRWSVGSKALAIPVPRSILALAPRRRAARLPEKDPLGNIESLPVCRDFPAALCEVLKGYLRSGEAKLQLAAELVCMSPRTLQRRLGDMGLSFSEILEQARFEVAAELLAEPGLQAIDVAFLTGYKDPSNFSRAFRRVAGVSPRAYRRQLLA